MDEARRFLRYISPGVVFAVECIVLLLIVQPQWTLQQLSGLKEDQGLGLAVGLLLASGAVGFILSTVHHALHWSLGEPLGDYQKWLQRLTALGRLEVIDQATGRPMEPEQIKALSRISAWSILTTLWHERAKSQLEAPTTRAMSLADLAHSIGTLRIATLLAATTAIWIASSSHQIGTLELSRVVLAGLVAVLLLILQWDGYLRTARLGQAVIEQSLTDCLVKESHPVKVCASPNMP